MLTKPDNDTAPTITKRSYSYTDIIKSQTDSPYTSMGKIIVSQKPSAPRATFGTAEKSQQKKLMSEKQLLGITVKGKEGNGPAAYLPSRYKSVNGEEVERQDLDAKLKFDVKPSYSIGKSPRKGFQHPVYNYMNSKNDNIELREADLKRRNSSASIGIGVAQRFQSIRSDKITPGPTYDPKLKADATEAPKYTLGSRRAEKGKDPLQPSVGTTNLVGPNSYFQRGGKSHSTSSLSRVPYDSKLKNQPVVSFAKGPRTLTNFKTSVDQTYDIKTYELSQISKTIMANYDFQYDAGKGLNSGKAWDKKYLTQSSQMPLEKNKMKSFTVGRETRQKQKKRGTFISTMTNVPMSVRMNHPKF